MPIERHLPIADRDLRELERDLDGTLRRTRARSAGEACIIHHAACERSPHFLLKAGSTQDVVGVVAFGRARYMEVAERRGHHSLAALDGRHDLSNSFRLKKNIEPATGARP